jgi:aryl-alcohol dehydrogenase-like predicted oxidoreductase
MSFPQRKIGDDLVSAMGLGCMGMSYSYTSFGGMDDEESLRVLTRAADMGLNMWDTADIYGNGKNEELLGRWFKETGRRKEIFLCTKFGHVVEQGVLAVKGDKEHVLKSCEASLQRLGVDYIDLYYQHRVDDKVPIEETVEAMSELKTAGKIRYLGLSECSSKSLRRAHKVHPIAAVQMEFSPFALEIESDQTGLLKTARELGVKIVAYSPLGRGFLTGSIRSRADLDATDNRLNHPRFSEENFPANLKLTDTLATMAKEKGVTAGQLVIAWVMAQG